jgi:hypothetical protein
MRRARNTERTDKEEYTTQVIEGLENNMWVYNGVYEKTAVKTRTGLTWLRTKATRGSAKKLTRHATAHNADRLDQ